MVHSWYFGRFSSRLVDQEVLASSWFAIVLLLCSRNLKNDSEHVIGHKQRAVMTWTLQTHSDGLISWGLTPEAFEQPRQWGPRHHLQPLWLEEFPHPSWAAPAATHGHILLPTEEERELHSYPFSLWAKKLEMFLPLQQAMARLPISGQLMQFSCHMTACYDCQAVITQPKLSWRNLETCRSWWWKWTVHAPAGLCCTWFLFHSSQTLFFSGRQEWVWHFLASGVLAGSPVFSAEGTRKADRCSGAGSGVLPGVLVWWEDSRVS